MILLRRNAGNSIHIVKFRLCKSAEKNCSEAGSYYSGLAYEKRHPKVSFAVVVGGYDEFAINCPNAMRGCDLRRFKCEDEGAYLAYVTEIRDTQKGRKVRPSLRLVVGLNRAADCVTARASNECVGGAYACGFCRFRKRRHSRRRTRGHLVRWKEKDICPQVFAIFPTITKRRRASRLLFVMVGLNRLELSTSRLSGVCSNQLSYNPSGTPCGCGGDARIRTEDLLNANQALYQLSYTPAVNA